MIINQHTKFITIEDGHVNFILFLIDLTWNGLLLNFSNERTLSCGQYKMKKPSNYTGNRKTHMPYIHTGYGGGDKVTQFSQS